jgi:hypothetical protein
MTPYLIRGTVHTSPTWIDLEHIVAIHTIQQERVDRIRELLVVTDRRNKDQPPSLFTGDTSIPLGFGIVLKFVAKDLYFNVLPQTESDLDVFLPSILEAQHESIEAWQSQKQPYDITLP